MEFNDHSKLVGEHSFLSASNYHWINYSEEKLAEVYANHLATLNGTETHEFAALCIRRGQKLPNSRKTLSMYVNDCIGFKMTPEQPLVYSLNAFGTADAISFTKNKLKIFDLKTGSTKASMHQLEIYAAYFCLEYDIRPGDIEIELRIYQSGEIMIANPTAEIIAPIMDKIVTFDKIIERVKEGN